MSSFTKFAYKIAEKAFKKPPSTNKKTMTAVASKVQWLLIISAFVAAAADDASSLRGPRDVALAPQGLDLVGEPIPQEAPAPQDAERRDAPPAGDEAAPVAGEAGPLVNRRLQAVVQELEDVGWTVYRNKVLSGKKGRLVEWKVVELSECVAECLKRDWCLSFDFGDGECFLSHISEGGQLVADDHHDHYLAPGSQGTLNSVKGEYADGEAVTLDFALSAAGDSGYSVGIYMRMADPQGGDLDPIVALPLPPGLQQGSVTFSRDTMGTTNWPLDVYEWGTGYDAYVLDGNGADVVGPAQFNILLDE